jgi:hypothetical protein
MGSKTVKYTCSVYREEMILLGLKQRLHKDDLCEDERNAILREIETIEKRMGL